MTEIIETKAIEQVNDNLFKGVAEIIDDARQRVVVYVNKHANMMFWQIGHFIIEDLGYKQYSAYGDKILATLSQRLTARYGRHTSPIVQAYSSHTLGILKSKLRSSLEAA